MSREERFVASTQCAACRVDTFPTHLIVSAHKTKSTWVLGLEVTRETNEVYEGVVFGASFSSIICCERMAMGRVLIIASETWRAMRVTNPEGIGRL